MKTFLLPVWLPVMAAAFSPDLVRSAMPALDLERQTVYPGVIVDYFRFYGLDFADADHRFGSLRSDSFTIASHVFIPRVSRGTMIVVHGFYDHAGIERSIIRTGLDSGFTVAAIDLPGHGLSSGERSSIDDFSRYGQAIGDLLAQQAAHFPRPLVLVGHSTGCAAIVEYLHRYGQKEVAGVILCAPLVRSAYWDVSRLGYWMAGAWLSRVPRWFRNESADKVWLKWYRHEPLQETTFPTRWARAVYAWNERIPGYTPLRVPVTVIQGRKDDSVDWRNNLKALAGLCRDLTVRMIDRGRHQLANEGEPVRGEFLRILGRELVRVCGSEACGK